MSTQSVRNPPDSKRRDGTACFNPAVCAPCHLHRRFLKDRFGQSEPPPGTRVSVVAQSGCYHGDTLVAMNVAVPSKFNRGQHAW